MAIRPYEDLSDEDLANQIAELQGRGIRPTPVTYSGLVGPSDYTSPMGTRGLRVQQTPEDVELNATRAERNALAKDIGTRKDYWGQMGQAEETYNKAMDRAFVQEQKDRLTRDLQDVERQLQGYSGNVPRGTRSFEAGWAGMDKEPVNTQDKRYQDLMRQKYSIQNALLGQKIDVKEAIPERKAGGQMMMGPDGSMIWYDEQGGARRILDREKPEKAEKAPEPNFMEKEEIKAAIETRKDPMATPEQKAEAKAYLERIDKKYGGTQGQPAPGQAQLDRSAQIEQYMGQRDAIAEEVADLVAKKHPNAQKLIEGFRKQFPNKEDQIYLDSLLGGKRAAANVKGPKKQNISEALTATESEAEKARKINEQTEKTIAGPRRAWEKMKQGRPGYEWLGEL